MTAPERILIVKLSAIGDVVHSLPFLEVVKRTWPQAGIDWVVEEAAAPIVLGHPALDRVWVSRRKAWQRALTKGPGRAAAAREAAAFAGALRREPYDLVVDLQGLFKSGVITGLARGRRKVGMSGAREGSAFFLTEAPVPVDYETHAMLRYLEVARALGCDTSVWDGVIPVGAKDREEVERLFEEHRWGLRPLVALNPMAKWATKLWEPERFGALADRIGSELQADIAFTGGPEDRGVIEAILGGMSHPAANLAGRTGLKTLAWLYRRAALLVCTDTGPMHMAAAMGCPVVALFGPTAPWRTGPYGPQHRVVRTGIACSPCFRKRCEERTCMRRITVESVFAEVAEALQVRQRNSA